MSNYLQDPISNGVPKEQALIRRWWHEEHGAAGRIVWEYTLEDRSADAIWFYADPVLKEEAPGRSAPQKFPLLNAKIILCEAKAKLTPEVIGQALVYTELAKRAGAVVCKTVVFAESGTQAMQEIAQSFGLIVVIKALNDL
jgi:hypothetical protein